MTRRWTNLFKAGLGLQLIGLVTLTLNSLSRRLPCKEVLYKVSMVGMIAFVVGHQVWLISATALRFNLAGQTVARAHKGIPYMPWTGLFLKIWTISLWCVNSATIMTTGCIFYCQGFKKGKRLVQSLFQI